MLRWEENSAVADFMNICHSKLFFNTINKPTRVTATSATLIDHIWSNDINGIVDNGIIYSKVSDHFPVFSIFELRGDKPSTTQTIKRRNFCDRNLILFRESLRNACWDLVYAARNPRIPFRDFSACFDRHFLWKL